MGGGGQEGGRSNISAICKTIVRLFFFVFLFFTRCKLHHNVERQELSKDDKGKCDGLKISSAVTRFFRGRIKSDGFYGE